MSLYNFRFYFLFCTIIFISCSKQESLFTRLDATETNITFQNNLPERAGFGILYYIYYYNGGGVATGDINNDGLIDIYFTSNSKNNNKLYLNKGDFKFEDITEKAGIAGKSDWCSGVTMADVNADSYLDIYVSTVSGVHGLTGHNELYINNKNGTFTESAAAYGLDFAGLSTQAAFFDYDHDGDLDCYLLNHSQKPHANIVDTSNRRKYDEKSGDRLYRNDQSANTVKFTDISAQAGIYQSSLGYGLGISVADINNDGWEDIYIGNDFHENDYYYVNNGDGTFAEKGAATFDHYSRFSMGNDIADYNNDGQSDIVTADMLPDDEKILKTYGSDESPDIYNFKLVKNGFQNQYSRNCLQRNNGNGSSFSETGLLSGIAATDWSWAPLFADLDNDGNKDLFITSGIMKRPVDMDFVRYVSDLYLKASQDGSGSYDKMALEKMPDGKSHPFLFKGDGDLSFKDVSADWGIEEIEGYFNGASYADLDNDGDLDIIVNAINAPAVLLKNGAPKKNYLTIKFEGDSLNTTGIGCKAYLYQNGKLQYQQLMLTRGFLSSSDSRLHFGLDTISRVDSMLLIWPDGKYQIIKDVAANRILKIQKQNAGGNFNYATFFPTPTDHLTKVTESGKVNWKHIDNNFNDFNEQYLIPHAQSTRGPKLAISDVNKDGLDDVFACGAKGQSGTLMVQQKDGSFSPIDEAMFGADAACEDVDALFFDANGDSFADLYVVSGGNEYFSNDPYLLDRLYINDTKGHFTKSSTALPPIYKNKSCVSAADIDKDGDQDLFVGTLSDAKAYGIPQTSYLLINDGGGKFNEASEKSIALSQIGLVTGATFADINNDQWNDLIVVGEWMPITIFINNKGTFKKTTIPNSTGLWQALYVDDVNNDGIKDLLAGNWGWNNKFWIGKEPPLKMYVADFDNNGRTEQLLSYTINGKEYPFLAKDEVEKSLPLLKKHYLLYAEYAGVPMKDVFYGWIDKIEPFTTEELGSVVCYGDKNGAFKMVNLPAHLQYAPIFSFQKINANTEKENTYLSGGNFFDVIPYEGQYDAQSLKLFKTDNRNNIQVISQPALSSIKGQIRDLKWVRTAFGNRLMVARNNDSLEIFSSNK